MHRIRSLILAQAGFAFIAVLLSSLQGQTARNPSQATQVNAAVWQKLFDGMTLEHWQPTNFGGQGNVQVEDGKIVLEMGGDLTGVTWQGEFPKINYEMTFQAMRVEGGDFFCGVTFPVAKSFCSLILGGWGGTVVGLSSIDGRDASENETSQLMNFEAGKWYQVRVRVTDSRVEAWIDEKQIVNQETAGHKIGIRPELDLSRPFGIASWRTKAAVREIRVRPLPQ